MKSERLDEQLAEEVVGCLKVAAGEVIHSLGLLDGKLSDADFKIYKRMVGKIVIAIYSGLADPVLEEFPDLKNKTYET